jgi:hypothetical protein
MLHASCCEIVTRFTAKSFGGESTSPKPEDYIIAMSGEQLA